ncbi:hypothetical protein GOODEAATRI_020035, partial [Goodea atripinnis]
NIKVETTGIRKGLRTQPCGAPVLMMVKGDVVELNLTACLLLRKLCMKCMGG